MASIAYRPYVESDLPHVMSLVQSELSEPYVIYTFRYFLYQWPHLAFLAYPDDPNDHRPIGAIVCKQSTHKNLANRGYIAMLSVDKLWRKRGIASSLVRHSLEAMKANGVEEIVLETEYDNHAALGLYESLGFIREKRLHRFYLNGKDAFRLILTVPTPSSLGDYDSDRSKSSTPRSSAALNMYRAIKVSESDDSDEESGR
ncbi:acyl-CoA N-acyltransferase [Flagelloscypha sp. PMI_526]|nr:acyl-CoA N-acyltransferase [Flagelloscypha sp. PMI_526]